MPSLEEGCFSPVRAFREVLPGKAKLVVGVVITLVLFSLLFVNPVFAPTSEELPILELDGVESFLYGSRSGEYNAGSGPDTEAFLYNYANAAGDFDTVRTPGRGTTLLKNGAPLDDICELANYATDVEIPLDETVISGPNNVANSSLTIPMAHIEFGEDSRSKDMAGVAVTGLGLNWFKEVQLNATIEGLGLPGGLISITALSSICIFCLFISK